MLHRMPLSAPGAVAFLTASPCTVVEVASLNATIARNEVDPADVVIASTDINGDTLLGFSEITGVSAVTINGPEFDDVIGLARLTGLVDLTDLGDCSALSVVLCVSSLVGWVFQDPSDVVMPDKPRCLSHEVQTVNDPRGRWIP